MRINFDVSFPDLPCAVVSLDATDASGASAVDVVHNVFKARLDASGAPVGDATRAGTLKTVTKAEDLLRAKQRAIAEGRDAHTPAAGGALAPGECGSCYGAGAEGACCDTCEEVREAYKRKGWQFNMKGVTQCEREGFAGDVSAQSAAHEGCNVYGHLDVPQVPGSFHFAPGHGLQHAYSHVHDLVSFTFQVSRVGGRRARGGAGGRPITA
jgi:endoplasmic reticulum-Golgi intermediate compartment protein 3